VYISEDQTEYSAAAHSLPLSPPGRNESFSKRRRRRRRHRPGFLSLLNILSGPRHAFANTAVMGFPNLLTAAVYLRLSLLPRKRTAGLDRAPLRVVPCPTVSVTIVPTTDNRTALAHHCLFSGVLLSGDAQLTPNIYAYTCYTYDDPSIYSLLNGGRGKPDIRGGK